MFRIVYIVLLVLAHIPFAYASPRVIKTIPEARKLSHADFIHRLPFELHGHILSVLDDNYFVLEEDGQRIMLRKSMYKATDISVGSGDIVVLRGHAEPKRLYRDWLGIYSAEVVGHKDIPPPEPATVLEILDGAHDLKTVTVRGEISAVFKDEIDDEWYYCVMRDSDKFIYLTIKDRTTDPIWARKIIGATIEATGFCSSYFGRRRFMRQGVKVTSPDSIRIIHRAPDPFNVPELNTSRILPLDDVMRMGRRKICGLVLAAWAENRILIKSTDGGIVRANLSLGCNLPAPGTMVFVAGTVATDFFRFNLEEAVVNPLPKGSASVDPAPVVDENSFFSYMKTPKSKVNHLGDTVRVTGIVNRIFHVYNSSRRIDIDAKGMHIMADANPARIPLEGIDPGCRVEITGTFVTDGDNWQPSAPFPRIMDWSLVVNEPNGIRLIARPPWWTAGRLIAVIVILLTALAASLALIYVLGLIVNRRGRALFREQIASATAQLRVDERTRLAAELHDSLSQNLSGIACQINVAKFTAHDAETKSILATTEQMLQSCRTELTRCISDLRCNTLEEPDFNAAITKNLKMLSLPTSIHVRFNIPRTKVSDYTAHSILCMVRELVTNAVRHGKASSINVAGSVEKTCLVFSVKDNGCGFNVASRPGIQEGHFGLEGIKDRINRLGGTFDINSSPQSGTTARISIPLSSNAEKDTSAL